MKDKVHSSSLLPAESAKFAQSVRENQNNRGFAKVVAGGRIVRLRNEVPFMKGWLRDSLLYLIQRGLSQKAILESVTSNLKQVSIWWTDRKLFWPNWGAFVRYCIISEQIEGSQPFSQDKTEAQQNL